MLVVRGTKKLRDRMRSVPFSIDEVSTTRLGDWYATALFWRPQVAMLVNERTLLPVYLPLAPAATLLDRIPAAIASVLRRHGVDEDIIAAELAAMREVKIAPTNNRSVVGVMNEFAFQGEGVFDPRRGDLEDLSLTMSRLIVGPLMKSTGSPDRELAALFGTRPSNVIAFPGSYQGDAAPGAASRADVYQLKITIKNTTPPVWRRVLVDGSSTLDELHQVIQAAFGWWNYHLHEFEVGKQRYGVPDPDDWGPPSIDERTVRIDAIAKAARSFLYTYDFGDGWDHTIDVEKILPAGDITVPACVGGRRACPPEDCGGAWGYQELLVILADRSHPEHRERVEWLGRPFDPDVFDPSEFAANLREVRLAVFDD